MSYTQKYGYEKDHSYVSGVCPHNADGESLQTRKVAANISKKQAWTASKVWSSGLGLGLTTPHWREKKRKPQSLTWMDSLEDETDRTCST
jgi:hypothetical protein